VHELVLQKFLWMRFLVYFIAIAVAIARVSAGSKQYASLCVSASDTAVSRLVNGSSLASLACPAGYLSASYGSFDDTVEAIGWASMNVWTPSVDSAPSLSDPVRGFAMGYVEGWLTAERISQQITNFYTNVFSSTKGKIPFNSGVWLHNQLEWAKTQCQQVGDSNAYWRAQCTVLAQFEGVVHGYVDALGLVDYAAAEMQVYATNSNDDIADLVALFDPKHAPVKDFQALTMMSCSALIKLLPFNSDLVSGHTTWRPYWGMLRIFKHYSYSLHIGSTVVSFSSAPGTLTSHDDFYLTSRGLLIMETTNNMFDLEYQRKFVKSSSLLSWQRAAVANIVADSGSGWVDALSSYNSGTYSNQWMIVDYKLFSAGHKIVPGTLTVAEQLPDRFVTQDMSMHLDTTRYWPSYNVPYFTETFDLSGYPAMVEKYGDDFTYDKNPRALIFARNVTSIQSFEEVQQMLQYNDWQHDPLSKGSPANSISSRYDLLSTKPVPFGGADSKVVDHLLFKTMSAIAISGPTHQQQEPFVWSTSGFQNTSHVGLPDAFNFSWQNVSPDFA
jgi:hypothetical protein